MKLKFFSLMLILLVFSSLVTATTLKGTIYNDNLEVEKNVLVEIDTTPAQKYLAKDGAFQFDLPFGTYTLTATKGFISVHEKIEIIDEGEYFYDLFLLPDFSTEEDLWQDAEEEYFSQELVEESPINYWSYLILGILFVIAIIRIVWTRKKYGPLKVFRKKVKVESMRTPEQFKEDLSKESGYLNEALAIIKKHDGRMTQKKLRKEMLHLSEAKVSLIVTELEHKGKIEKVKQGRGNVLLLK